jgi:adenylate cyclase
MGQPYGELVPDGGGDPIPLVREVMSLGRRKSNDICLEFANVSSQHCEFSYKGGVWYVRDLGSQNGTKINGERSTGKKVLKPGDKIGIATHKFTIEYQLTPESKLVLEEMLDKDEDIFAQSLMEKAGLTKPRRKTDDD